MEAEEAPKAEGIKMAAATNVDESKLPKRRMVNSRPNTIRSNDQHIVHIRRMPSDLNTSLVAPTYFPRTVASHSMMPMASAGLGVL